MEVEWTRAPCAPYVRGLLVVCHACRSSFEAPTGALAAECPSCKARVTITSIATKPVALVPSGGGGQPAPEALIGTSLGGYRLEKVLGGGGMGVVYEARREPGAEEASGPELAAVKVLSPAFATDPEFVERFRREADALIALRHPNLIEVYAKGEAASAAHGGAAVYFFVMERFFGEDLRALVARGPVRPAHVAAIVRGAAAGLAYAHAHGVVHRDVKPANILVSGDPTKGGVVKVVDFGVAQLAAGAYTLTSLTRSNLVLGTINYMSPEQRTDASEIDQRADVYALGVVAYELLTARLPIGAFEPPSELVPDVSGPMDRAVLSALRRDPAQRPAGTLDFAARLDRALVVPGRVRLAAVGAAAVATGLVISALAPRWLARVPPSKGLEKAPVESKVNAPVEPAVQANAQIEPAQTNATDASPALVDVVTAMRTATAFARSKMNAPSSDQKGLDVGTKSIEVTKVPSKPKVAPASKKKRVSSKEAFDQPEALEPEAQEITTKQKVAPKPRDVKQATETLK